MTQTKSPGAVAAPGASEIDELRWHVAPEPSLPQICAQDLICATLIGSDRCSALGIAVRGRAPALALARSLIEAGYDPNRPLNVYREGVLALAIRSIGEASRLTVEDDQHGRPRLRHWRNRRAECGAGSPVALSGQRVIQPSAQPKSMYEAAP
jgi:hypothetical protein